MKVTTSLRLAGVALAVSVVAAACGSSSNSTAPATGGSATSSSATTATGSSGSSATGGTVNVGIATSLSGSIADLGQTGVNGIKMALNTINASGGLLGKKINLVTADDHADPATGATAVRNMILNNHVVAQFGAVASSVGVAEEAVTSAAQVPFFAFTDNDVTLMTKHGNPYSFELVPNTYMEPRAVAYFVHKLYGTRPIKVATITPNYNFGLSEVTNFIAGLKQFNVNYTVVTQQTPALGAPNYDSNISAILAASPNFVFGGLYGGDLITFTKQAAGFGLFSKVKMAAQYGRGALQALGTSNPAAGGIGFDRAAFWAMKSLSKPWIAQYHAQYKQWPSAYAILGYTSVQAWAYAVKKANSFKGATVSAQLPGATISTIRGPVTIRACDHQAIVPEYVGTISSKVNSTYGFPIYTPSSTISVPASKIIDPCGYKS